MHCFTSLNYSTPSTPPGVESLSKSLNPSQLQEQPYVLTFMWTAARKKIYLSFRDQYTITGPPSLPNIISHLWHAFGHSHKICAKTLFLNEAQKSSRGPFIPQSPPGHHMLHVSIALINSAVVKQATHGDSQHSSGRPCGEHHDQALTEDQK